MPTHLLIYKPHDRTLAVGQLHSNNQAWDTQHYQGRTGAGKRGRICENLRMPVKKQSTAAWPRHITGDGALANRVYPVCSSSREMGVVPMRRERLVDPFTLHCCSSSTGEEAVQGARGMRAPASTGAESREIELGVSRQLQVALPTLCCSPRAGEGGGRFQRE
ncbi:hypothetical protein EJ06DRAFT_532910 [Trichodelitschia bisporula]|uniref:Uncharacterized protein n=1 Tax=Trichodelitschia bisporula TaxID=703511 RepID=A0A6G1HPT1_9PEZI|nr:hypothetical protein EJ06DRAFT_532910 [Trichodelitschia bisporula]